MNNRRFPQRTTIAVVAAPQNPEAPVEAAPVAQKKDRPKVIAAQTKIRGLGRIFQVKGSRNWRIAYNYRGQEHRESCGSPDRKVAEKL